MNSQLQSCRHGFSLLEVLVSVFVVLIGLLGVATMIPAGRYEMTEARKADMGANLSRALLRSAITQLNDEWTTTDVCQFIINDATLQGAKDISTYLTGANLTKCAIGFNNNSLLDGDDDVYWTVENNKVSLWDSTGANGKGLEVIGSGHYLGLVTVIPQGNGYYEVTAAVAYRTTSADCRSIGVTINAGGMCSGANGNLPQPGNYVMINKDNDIRYRWYRVENIYESYVTLQGPDVQPEQAGNATMIIPGNIISVCSRTVRLGQ